MDQLQRSAHSFKTTVAAFLTENWFLLTDRERHVVEAFLTRLQDATPTAAPLDLYSSSRCLLLQMLSLAITYIIIMLQSK
jgi:hypothetical protein